MWLETRGLYGGKRDERRMLQQLRARFAYQQLTIDSINATGQAASRLFYAAPASGKSALHHLLAWNSEGHKGLEKNTNLCTQNEQVYSESMEDGTNKTNTEKNEYKQCIKQNVDNNNLW